MTVILGTWLFSSPEICVANPFGRGGIAILQFGQGTTDDDDLLALQSGELGVGSVPLKSIATVVNNPTHPPPASAAGR